MSILASRPHEDVRKMIIHIFAMLLFNARFISFLMPSELYDLRDLETLVVQFIHRSNSLRMVCTLFGNYSKSVYILHEYSQLDSSKILLSRAAIFIWKRAFLLVEAKG